MSLRPSPSRRPRRRLAMAALGILDEIADGAPLLCGCEEPGCPACD
ncbi:MAG: hypothetical protein ACYCSJ_12985 [Acidimicrobiales bacterium]